MEVRPWWGPPRNFDDRKNERKISWLELFYDLVYVAVIGQLTHHLAAHPTWQILGYSFLIFSLVFWSWVNGSQYYDLHGDDTIRTRLQTFWQMLAVAAVAVTVNDVFEGHHIAFVIAFSMVQIVVTYLWFSVGLYDPTHKVFTKFYNTNYFAGFIIMVASAFVAFNVAVFMWGMVLLLNLLPPFTAWHTIISEGKKRGQVFTASAAIVERFGLFTIIVLAESILGTVNGISEIEDKHTTVWIAFILGILISFLLWCLYFDMTSEQETKKGYAYMQALNFLHFPLLASLSVVGACIKVLITQVDISANGTVYWMFCVSLSIILLCIVGVASIMQEEEEDRAYIRPVSRILIAVALIIPLIPLFAQYLNSLFFLTTISVLLFIPVIIGIQSWVRYRFFGGNNPN